MTIAVTVRHRVAIYGNVSDAVTGRPIEGARVEITQGPQGFSERLALQARAAGKDWPALQERPDRTRTAADGHFHFMDLPAGNYSLAATLAAAGSRYGSAQAQATLTEDARKTVSRAQLELKLPPTTVRGTIKDGQGNPVRFAEVGLRGGPERAVADGVGFFVLSGLEAGKRTFVVSARGFKDLSRTVDVAPGVTSTADFNLQPSPPVV
ncbi:MAG TPA: carboxypeptidase regulatory-like domain-containing protein [Thermoanaerobaculia bacterium]